MTDTLTGTLLQNRFCVGSAFEHEGMSDVYRAQDIQLAVDVVVKFLPDFASERKSHLFEREGKQLAQLKGHRNIVEIVSLGVLTDDNRPPLPYIVCEYLPRGDLRQLIPIGDDIDTFLSVAIDIVSGLSAAHAQNIVHRDIKPSNVFLGRDGTAKVGDFGISKLVEDSRSDESAFGGGTAGYRPPEALDSNANQALLDVFSVGVTLYELLTGNLPYDPRNPFELESARNDRPIEPPHRRNPSVSIELSDIVMEMISLLPATRPPSFEAVRKALEAERNRRAYLKPDQETVLRTPALQRIRKLVRDKIEKTTTFFGRSVLAPRLDEEPDWYADVLLRPAATRQGDGTTLADVFHPVYFAHFTYDNLSHWSDWVRTTSLIKRPLAIDRCCAGLPIRLHEMAPEMKKELLSNRWIECKVSPRNQIEYVLLRDVTWLCSPACPVDNIVRQCYATDVSRPDWPNAVGWSFYNDAGEHHAMSRRIQTELLIPLYDPLLTQRAGAQDVLGVLNFEWDEKLAPEREQEICAQIHKWIYVEQRFPLSSFIAQILRLATEPM